MRIKLQIAKDGTSLYAGAYDIEDAQSFGKAYPDAWQQLQQAKLETSVGAVMEHVKRQRARPIGRIVDHDNRP